MRYFFVILVLLFTACFLPDYLCAQNSFDKHTMLLEIKPGFGVFGTQSFNDISGPSANGAAVLTILPVTVEYGITKWLGIGGVIQTSHLVQNQDSVSEGKGIKGNTFEIGPLVNAHFVRIPHFDMYGGAKFEYSALKISSLSSGIVLKSGGTVFNLCLGSRLIIGKHFDLSSELGYTYYNYPNGIIDNDPGVNNVGFSLSLSGVTFNIGLGYKF